MDIQAKTRYVRLSPTKARDLARAMRGKPAAEALKIVEFSERKAAVQLAKTLRSAIANAVNNASLAEEGLYVREALVNQGPSMRRHFSRSRGMASPIRKPSSHITITLTDEQPSVQ